MPELPEVQTIVNDLNKRIKGSKILGVSYCDNKKYFKGTTFEKFKKEIKNREIISVKRRAKYVLMDLSGDKLLLFHLKMTGHLLVVGSKYYVVGGKWEGKDLPKELQDPRNQFIHLVLELSDGKILAFSDMRKFGVVRLENSDYLASLENKLGPEPLGSGFSLNQFQKVLEGSNGKIKAVLMDQSKIAGIGNIYGDEILFLAGVRPDRLVKKLKKEEIEKIYGAIRTILEKALKYRGSSESDYRDADGKKGHYQEHSFVYRRDKNACGECGGEIKKIKIGQRSAHYCTKCQK
jgi:formamidopyrimidine-DNA glycosylase